MNVRPVLLRSLPAVSALAAFALTTVGIGRWPWLDRIDMAAHVAAPEHPDHRLLVLTRAGFLLGDAILLACVGVTIAAMLAWRWRRWYPLMIYLSVCTAHIAVIALLKLWAGRGEPISEQPALHSVPGSLSYPSGHAANILFSFAIAATFLHALTGRAVWRRWISLAAAGVLAVFATSVLYLGYHWVTDVVAGTAVGIAEWTLVSALEPALSRRPRHTC